MRRRPRTGIAPTGPSRSRSNKSVLAAAVIAFRFLQYSGAMILLGSSLFFVYGLPADGPCAALSHRWPRQLLIGGAALLFAAALGGLIAQTGLLAGALSEGFKPDNLVAVMTQMNFGASAVARATIAAMLLVSLIALGPSRGLWLGTAIGGAIVCASLAWMGHGAATEGVAGWIHLAGDIGHALAAAVWIGALVAFVLVVSPEPGDAGRDGVLHQSLKRFSGVGSIAVAMIVLTGLVNSWFLVGPDRWIDFWATLYGQVLLAKLLAFAIMLGFAASNRYRLTPALGNTLDTGAPRNGPLLALRRSLVTETLVAFSVLGLVAWLGTLPPPTAG